MAVAVQQITFANSIAGRTAGNFVRFLCDTEAELPSTNVISGDFALALDTGNAFTRQAGVWVYVPAATSPAAGVGSPEGMVARAPGTPYTDTATGDFYTKQTGTGNTGWLLQVSS